MKLYTLADRDGNVAPHVFHSMNQVVGHVYSLNVREHNGSWKLKYTLKGPYKANHIDHFSLQKYDHVYNRNGYKDSEVMRQAVIHGVELLKKRGYIIFTSTTR